MKGPRLQLYASLNGYLEELLLAYFKALTPSDNWSEGRADSFFEIGIGKTPPRKEAEWFANNRNGNYVWLSIKDMGTPGAYSLDSSEYLTHAAVKQKNIRQVPEGSILLSFKLTVGRVKIAACDMTTNEAIACFNSSDKKQLAYIYPYLLTYDYNKLGSTSSIATAVNSKTIKAMPIVMPNSNELSLFYTATKPLYEQMLNIAKENIALASLRDALLPKLMSGEIDVSKIDLTQLNSHLAEHSTISGKLFPSPTMEGTAMENAIQLILAQMQSVLNSPQLKRLKTVLTEILPGGKTIKDDSELLPLFLTAKEVEGCSPKTIEYYRSTLDHMTETLAKPYTQIESDDLRKYLNDYEATRGSSKVTIDNIRRIMSSFFSWLEDEDYIVKSPVRRIHRVKTVQVAKEVLTDEDLETLRNVCDTKRDLAVIDLLVSTGMRIGELVKLNIEDVNLAERECLVMGKGNKQRPVYFDARTKLHLEEYLHTRADHAPALFVALDSSARRVTIGNLEQRLRKLGKSAGVCHVHPHKFRRTLATHAIDKGMPIEQVQKLLGHAKIDTTMHYAMVNQNNVKASHRKYLE